MHCHACDSHLPTDVSECFDKETGRYYCGECGAVINDLIEAMTNPEKEGQIKLTIYEEVLEEELLDDDFDSEEPPSEKTYPSFSLPPENYDE